VIKRKDSPRSFFVTFTSSTVSAIATEPDVLASSYARRFISDNENRSSREDLLASY